MILFILCMALALYNQTKCMSQADTISHCTNTTNKAQAKAARPITVDLPRDIKNELLTSIAAVMPTCDALQAMQTLTTVNSQWQSTIQNSDTVMLKTLAARLKLPLFLTAAYLKKTLIDIFEIQNHELCKAVQDARFIADHLKTHKAHKILNFLENHLDTKKTESLKTIHFLKNNSDNSEIAWIYDDNSYLINCSYQRGLTKTLHLLKCNEHSICDVEFAQDYIASPQAIDGSNIEHNNTFLGVHLRQISFECGEEKPQLAVQDNGKVIVMLWHGMVKKQFYLVRLTEKGSADYSFGQKGIALQKSNGTTINASTDIVKPAQLLVDPQTNGIVVTYNNDVHSFTCDGKEISQ